MSSKLMSCNEDDPRVEHILEENIEYVITCKCGHEEVQSTMPDEQWICPDCRRVGCYTVEEE